MGKSLVFLLLLILYITTRANSDAGVTSCDACHAEATCLTLEERGNTPSSSLSCTCKEGFVGDGLSCYEVKECGSSLSCCNSGYKWSPKQGCVDVDECSLTPSPCGASQVCKNTEGSFECITTPLETQLNENAVQFSCGNDPCPRGMDCITVSGTSRCADPCHYYSVINDDWRGISSPDIGKCDQRLEWQGWYRMLLKGTSARIPQRCIWSYSCGSSGPMFLTSPHPEQFNDIESRQVCTSWNGCDSWCHNIHVKKCYGQYYVYKLVKTRTCALTYCAEIPPEPEVEVHQLICGQDKIQVALNEGNVSSSGLDPLSGHLVNRSCTYSRVENGLVWYEVDVQGGACGNAVTNSDTNITFSNSIFLYSPQNFFVSVSFSCVYPLEAYAALDAPIEPLIPSRSVVGTGDSIRASMSLYRDLTFSTPFPPGKVSLPVGQRFYVDVVVQENSLKAVNVLDNCYATYSRDPHDPVRLQFIQNKCSTDPKEVTVIESGTSLHARFSARFFLPQDQFKAVYIHCYLSMCSPGPCAPNCSRRKRRFVSEAAVVQTVTSIGPITWET